MQQQKEDANLTIEQLKKLMTTGDSNAFMKKMSSYAANITGSDAYWSRRRSELEATFEQAKTASAFFTFSYPDNHWEDLQKLMPGPLASTFTEKYKKVLNNPHLVDWFFSHKLNEFLKTVFDDVLECEWRWHRYEWQSRSSIHAHGAVRFKNDPGLTQLATKAYIGRLASKKLADDHDKHNLATDIIDK